jgi:serine/threonine-protein kinase
MSHQSPQEHAQSGSSEGERFGRYRLRGILGQGGMGRLYVAEQVGIEGFSKVVALKRILPHLADSQHFRAMFLNEARVAARLEHPNIVATFELGEVDGNYFISMEYLSGEDLAAVLTRCQSAGPMPLEIAVALAQQSANGLHYAHEMRDTGGKALELVHRDVSPLNIFVTYYGMVKLLDFGIVKGVTDPSRTVPGVFKGKYAYCSPEQLDGGVVTRQTDIFCLGIVLWEC